MSDRRDMGEVNLGYTRDDEISRRRLLKKKRRQKRRAIAAFFALLAVAACLAVYFVISNKTYNFYTLISSADKESEGNVSFEPYKGGYIKYTSLGVSYVNKNGNLVWNLSYTMQNPALSRQGDNFIIADIEGNDIYMYDESGQVGIARTEYQIIQANAAGKGVAEAILKTDGDSYVNMYNKDGSVIYSIKTNLTSDGYPVVTAVSEDSSKLMVSYVKSDGGNIRSNLVFYDFSQDRKFDNKIAAAFDNFNGEVIGYVSMLSDKSAAAVSETAVHYYSLGRVPKEDKVFQIDKKILKVFSGDGKIGLITENDDEKPFRLIIYNDSGSCLCDLAVDVEYNDYAFNGATLLMYSDNSFAVMNLSGRYITRQTIEDRINTIIPAGGTEYYLVNDMYIQKIKLA